MKILFISKYLSTSKTGAESRLATIIRYFKKNNIQVAAITSNNSIKKYKSKKTFFDRKIDNVNYFFINDFSDYTLYSFKRIFSWLKFEYYLFKFDFNKLKFKPDIIYVSSLSLFTILNGIFLKKKFNAKLVFEMRDLWPYFLITTGKFSNFNPLIYVLKIIEGYGIYHSDLIIGLIPRIDKYIKFRGFKKKTFASTFPYNKKFFKKKLNIKNYKISKKFNVCYAGNFGYDNYLKEFLQLVSHVKNKNYIFHLFGRGSLKEKLIKNFGHLKNVKFYDHVPYENLHSILTQMDLLVVSFGFQNKYPIYGYELNKLNNYLFAEKPILALGNKKNLLNNRGNFVFLNKFSESNFEKKINFIKKNKTFFSKLCKQNKKNFLERNNPNLIFEKTLNHLKNL